MSGGIRYLDWSFFHARHIPRTEWAFIGMVKVTCWAIGVEFLAPGILIYLGPLAVGVAGICQRKGQGR